ncbi:MAG: ubiquinol-cytochrome c reductase iron-sulfur subunit [Burkholderiaceae bacterium]
MSTSKDQGGQAGANPQSNAGSDISFPEHQTRISEAKRNSLVTTAAIGAIGAASTAFAFVSTLAPSERAKAAGAPVETDISDIKPGEMKRVEWRGNPVWILHRTPEMLATLGKHDDQLVDPNSEKFYQLKTPSYALNETRSIKPPYLVLVGICPHLGCSPSDRFTPGAQASLPDDWPGGYICPCHGSTFDLSGRVYKNKPANVNMDVPPHMYLSDTTLLIGEDQTA